MRDRDLSVSRVAGPRERSSGDCDIFGTARIHRRPTRYKDHESGVRVPAPRERRRAREQPAHRQRPPADPTRSARHGRHEPTTTPWTASHPQHNLDRFRNGEVRRCARLHAMGEARPDRPPEPKLAPPAGPRASVQPDDQRPSDPQPAPCDGPVVQRLDRLRGDGEPAAGRAGPRAAPRTEDGHVLGPVLPLLPDGRTERQRGAHPERGARESLLGAATRRRV
jgi:hypothetical protein